MILGNENGFSNFLLNINRHLSRSGATRHGGRIVFLAIENHQIYFNLAIAPFNLAAPEIKTCCRKISNLMAGSILTGTGQENTPLQERRFHNNRRP